MKSSSSVSGTVYPLGRAAASALIETNGCGMGSSLVYMPRVGEPPIPRSRGLLSSNASNVRDLCLALGAKSVYYVLALIVSYLLEPKHAFFIVQLLNRILLTQPALSDFRDYLRGFDPVVICPHSRLGVFEQLYRAWCHNPVALLSLCLLTRNYNHCRKLINGELAVSVEVLVEMDQLIQLLESPVFASALLCSLSLSHFHHLELASVRAFLIAGLRLHLVDRRYSAALQETLYCLLMCLPQTEAFETLRRRLQCLPSHTLVEAEVYVLSLFVPLPTNFNSLIVPPFELIALSEVCIGSIFLCLTLVP
ncbi:unnamed protein product [Mesocestoides corti]|uniref:Vacuolar protein 14 C-terminal Fig4-binding domain-containing protein n=1 Tax=Mesocestoides corti TaxID=53468 RepID=A0A0R3UCJ9_MESCO|nr:unnamed protein product [Mesocestoides corti]